MVSAIEENCRWISSPRDMFRNRLCKETFPSLLYLEEMKRVHQDRKWLWRIRCRLLFSPICIHFKNAFAAESTKDDRDDPNHCTIAGSNLILFSLLSFICVCSWFTDPHSWHHSKVRWYIQPSRDHFFTCFTSCIFLGNGAVFKGI